MSIPAQQAANSADLEAIQLRINQLRQQEAQYANDTTAAGQQQLQNIRNQLTAERTLHAQRRAGLVDQTAYTKEFSSFAKSYAKLSSTVKAQLQTQTSLNTQTSIYKSIGEDIARSKAREAELSGDQLELERERGALMTEINASYLSQAKATAKALDDAAGLTEFDKMRRELKETTLELSDEERKKLEDAINATETLYKKEQRIKAIQEEKKTMYEAVPESLRNGIDFAQKLGDTLKTAGAGAAVFMILAAVVVAALASFKALDDAAKEFRTETGLTNSQTAEIKKNANEIVGEFGHLGIEAKNVFDTVSALKNEFSDIYDSSKQTQTALTVLGANFGVTAENAAKVQGVFERMGGVSGETAANLQLQAAKMAELAGVAPAKVAQDIADAAEESYKFFKGNVNALTQAAIQARRLGTNLKDVLETNRKLLDFEGSIEDELVAATFAGGQFNLTQARILAASGRHIDAEQEVLKQIQRSGDFRDADLWTQEALAKGAGMEVEEVIKKLDAQEKLASLSVDERTRADEAIKKGLDITNITEGQLEAEIAKFETQQAQQAVLDQLQNQFTGIASTVGSALVPALEVIAPMLQLALIPIQHLAEGLNNIINLFDGGAEKLTFWQGALFAIAGIWASITAFVKLSAMYTSLKLARTTALAAMENAVQIAKNAQLATDLRGLALGKTKLLQLVAQAAVWALSNPLMALAGIAAAAALTGVAFAAISKVGDVSSPADGKTVVSTKEGGLFELSPNDDLVAAPGAAAALAGGGDGDGKGRGRNVNVNNLSQLAAPLNAMINEIKGLRADMNAGKISVNMDGQKVTSTIGKQVDQSTRNNYSLAQA
jgi:hypothetical protein